MVTEIFDIDWRFVLAIPGIALGGIGTVTAAATTLTGESASGLLITGAGAAVTLYGIYAYAQSKQALTLREQIDGLTAENERLKVEVYHLRAVQDYCQANHSGTGPARSSGNVDRS